MLHNGNRITLAALEGFIGICALGGGYAVITGAFGFAQFLPLSWLDGTPFKDYTIPGLVLFVVIGGGMFLAASTIGIQRQWAVLLSAVMGGIMLGFEVVEVAIIDRNPQAVIPPTIVQQVLMAGLGLVIFSMAGRLWVREYGVPHTAARHA
jgi:hypothetical protein